MLDNLPRRSYETGESSTTDSLRNGTLANDSPSEPVDGFVGARHEHQRDGMPRRRQRHRSSGGFLLRDAAVGGELEMLHHRTTRTEYSSNRVSVASRARAAHLQGSDSDFRGSPHSERNIKIHERISPRPAPYADSLDGLERGHPEEEKRSCSVDQTPSAADLDPTRIVDMALSLSESRQMMTSRRSTSQPNPPRLVSLPNPGVGSNLKQHLQQQRRSLRNVSPRPALGSSLKVKSGDWSSSPLQAKFGASNGVAFQYQFSPSTLARVHKAKEHLELMTQYRRLLEILPPLKGKCGPSTAGSPPSSPSVSLKAFRQGGIGEVSLGQRQYNPLQYIRNRKVRARERKVIDGDLQGFGDIESVRSWVDQAWKLATLTKTPSTGSDITLPLFEPANDKTCEGLTSSGLKNAQRMRRPRVDWFFEPCDIIADAYWLEQDHHKFLIEDRHWHRLYPSPSESSKNFPRAADGSSHMPRTSVKSLEEMGAPVTSNDSGDAKPDADNTELSAAARAKQKLHDFRHNNFGYNHHGPLRLRGDSDSDLSESEDEAKYPYRKWLGRGRSGTITSDANHLLRKQMLEMIKREEMGKELEDIQDTEEAPNVSQTRDMPENASSLRSRQVQSLRESLVDVRESTERDLWSRDLTDPSSQHRSGRPILQLPTDPRKAYADENTSLPVSPERKPSRERSSSRIRGEDNLALARPSSPFRSPLSRVRRMLKDRERETGNITQESETDDDGDVLSRARDYAPTEDRPTPPGSRGSSPPARIAHWQNHHSHKSQRGLNAPRLRDDQPVGVRGMFKGPRIDTVIRGGVSRLGDILWKKDGFGDDPGEVESADESDHATRGLRRLSFASAGSKAADEHEAVPGPKNFLDTMPHFQRVNGPRKTSANDDLASNTLELPGASGPNSSRFDPLKTLTSVRSAPVSPSTSIPSQRRLVDSDAAGSDSESSTVPEGLRRTDKKLKAVMQGEGLNKLNEDISRPWSYTDKRFPQERTQLSKREVARIRALILSSGIKAMEINRRANERVRPFERCGNSTGGTALRLNATGIDWGDVAELTADQSDLHKEVACHELYSLAAHRLAVAVQSSAQRWQASAERFTNKTSVDLQKRTWALRSRVEDDLLSITRNAAAEADKTNAELALDQPLRVKEVNDTIEKMLRRRRRRFRWLRRAGWLTVEWLLVGLMWYVWFVVMVLRIFRGVFEGALAVVKWLLWL